MGLAGFVKVRINVVTQLALICIGIASRPDRIVSKTTLQVVDSSRDSKRSQNSKRRPCICSTIMQVRPAVAKGAPFNIIPNLHEMPRNVSFIQLLFLLFLLF